MQGIDTPNQASLQPRDRWPRQKRRLSTQSFPRSLGSTDTYWVATPKTQVVAHSAGIAIVLGGRRSQNLPHITQNWRLLQSRLRTELKKKLADLDNAPALALLKNALSLGVKRQEHLGIEGRFELASTSKVSRSIQLNYYSQLTMV